MTINFFVPGIPVPGGSKRAFLIHQKGCPAGRRKSAKGPCVCHPFTTVSHAAGQRNKNWRAEIIKFAFEEMKISNIGQFNGPLRVSLKFRMPRPKHHCGKHGVLPSAPAYPEGKPDLLKLARATEDALTGICWRDDNANVKLILTKEYAPISETPGVDIWIDSLQ